MHRQDIYKVQSTGFVDGLFGVRETRNSRMTPMCWVEKRQVAGSAKKRREKNNKQNKTPVLAFQSIFQTITSLSRIKRYVPFPHQPKSGTAGSYRSSIFNYEKPPYCYP